MMIKALYTFPFANKLDDEAWNRIISKALNNVANEARLNKIIN